jgi:ABC-type multidrug transport system fused ATPase/permease subunit
MTLVATGMIVIFGLVVRDISGRLRPLARRRAKLFAEISGRLTEAYGGIRVVKGYRGEEREQKVYRKGVEQIKHVAVRGVMLANLMGVTSAITLGIAVAALLYIGARDMLDHTMTIGQFVSYSSLMGFLAQPVQQMVTLGQQIPEGLAGIDRMQELLANPREDDDAGRTQPIGAIEGHVAFEDLRFAYESSQPILKGLSFEAKPGTATAFVGPSGSGKSTAINLIAAFYKATSGKVLVDGTDLATVRLDSYRAQLGLVLQESFLFDGTILENVAFSRPNATREEILEACKRARVDEFATRLEKGWETQVGERGVKLSGGQRQRISIARALLANPRILILDEATSALDTQSEALIQEALEDLMLGRTTFVIAHRLSTIRRVDQILVIDKGEIVERGKHDELLAQKGLYWQMYTQQHAGKLLGPGERERPEDEGVEETAGEHSTAAGAAS